ncbi:hypothetical protein OG21DRAFT_1017366 [Imleria badia]|nr:hypothetical protein OG21DRAFT_1017366 [Imleria badia]
MGPAGSGKSNFINKLTGNAEKPKASKLKPDTQDVTPYPIAYQGRCLVLVDTPAINADQRDGETLRVIADSLQQKCPGGAVVKIIYLHKITDNRASNFADKNLRTFGHLCGDIPQRRMRLVTTMWDQVKDQAKATQRETQLTSEFWQELMVGGATIHKFYNTRDSAERIIND